jgi:hypothetical protein
VACDFPLSGCQKGHGRGTDPRNSHINAQYAERQTEVCRISLVVGHIRPSFMFRFASRGASFLVRLGVGQRMARRRQWFAYRIEDDSAGRFANSFATRGFHFLITLRCCGCYRPTAIAVNTEYSRVTVATDAMWHLRHTNPKPGHNARTYQP